MQYLNTDFFILHWTGFIYLHMCPTLQHIQHVACKHIEIRHSNFCLRAPYSVQKAILFGNYFLCQILLLLLCTCNFNFELHTADVTKCDISVTSCAARPYTESNSAYTFLATRHATLNWVTGTRGRATRFPVAKL